MELCDRLRTLLAGEDLAAAWLFGSQARGTARDVSDVDVGLLLGRPPQGRSDLRLDLQDRLTAALGRVVQVVVLDEAPADLVHRVLREGLLLVERDRSARVRFQVRKLNEYFDLTPMYRETRRLPPGVLP